MASSVPLTNRIPCQPLAAQILREPSALQAQDRACAPAAGASIAPDAAGVLPQTKLDLLIVWGPGQTQRDLDAIRDHSKALGLHVEVLETEGLSEAELEERKTEWYCSGRLGAGTQVLISAHGASDDTAGVHYLSLSTADGAKSTLDFISWLRTPPAGFPIGPKHSGWNGILHVHSCRGGLLADEMSIRRGEWNRGNFIIHASRKLISSDTLQSVAFALCDAIAQAEEEGLVLTPAAMAAQAMLVDGDTVFCGGADFDEPLKIGAPRNAQDANPEHVIESLESQRHAAVRISGSARDRALLLAALRSRHANREDSRASADKLSNMILTRVIRAHPDQASELQKAFPDAHALALRKAGLEDLRVDALGVNMPMPYWHQHFLREVRSGRAAPEGLHAGLEHMTRWQRTYRFDAAWARELAPALRREPGLLVAGLKWAEKRRNGYELINALEYEFAQHPRDIASLLDRTMEEEDRERLTAFFKPLRCAQVTLMQRMSGEAFQSYARGAYERFMRGSGSDDNDPVAYIERRDPDLVQSLYRSQLEWLADEDASIVEFCAMPAKLKHLVLQGHFQGSTRIEAIVMESVLRACDPDVQLLDAALKLCARQPELLEVLGNLRRNMEEEREAAAEATSTEAGIPACATQLHAGGGNRDDREFVCL